jgi:hypothetical protein
MTTINLITTIVTNIAMGTFTIMVTTTVIRMPMPTRIQARFARFAAIPMRPRRISWRARLFL